MAGGGAVSRRRGAALVLALAAMVLLQGISALLLAAVTARLRLAADQRLALEGGMAVTATLAEARVTDAVALASLADGDGWSGPWRDRGGGWRGRVVAVRRGVLLRLDGRAERRDGAGGLRGAARATLLLRRGDADTVRMVGHRPRF